MDVTVLVTAHREGALLERTLRAGLAAATHAGARGLSVEMLVVADDADDATRAVITDFCAERHPTQRRSIEVSCKDVGPARNAGVDAARGAHVALIDGDDLVEERWLTLAHRTALAHPRPAIVHAELNYNFGASFSVVRQRPMAAARIDAHRLLYQALWTSLVFAPRNVFQRHPFPEATGGFGAEDWSWNVRTILDGYDHLIAASTCHFVRAKMTGSRRVAQIYPEVGITFPAPDEAFLELAHLVYDDRALQGRRRLQLAARSSLAARAARAAQRRLFGIESLAHRLSREHREAVQALGRLEPLLRYFDNPLEPLLEIDVVGGSALVAADILAGVVAALRPRGAPSPECVALRGSTFATLELRAGSRRWSPEQHPQLPAAHMLFLLARALSLVSPSRFVFDDGVVALLLVERYGRLLQKGGAQIGWARPTGSA